MLHLQPEISFNEFQTIKEALGQGIRSDMRNPKQPRKMTTSTSSMPGFALINLGKTVVTANTSASLVVPNPESPTRGFHNLTLQTPTIHLRSQLMEFQTYFRFLWHKCHIIEEGSLCIQPGEKVWKLSTELIIINDDGGLLDALFAAVFVSLSTLRFPSFHPTTGVLFSPSSHRTHRIALTFNPVLITVAFYDNVVSTHQTISPSEAAFSARMPNSVPPQNPKDQKFPFDLNQKENLILKNVEQENNFPPFIVDPTLAELQIATGYIIFVLNDNSRPVLIDSNLPGSISLAKEAAIAASNEWRNVLKEVVEKYDPGINCVGEKADFADYKPTQIVNLGAGKVKKVERFQIWEGRTDPEITLFGFE